MTAVREREEQLEQETRQLDEFVSTVSHDLRNPLTVARGYVETARADSDDEALAEAEASLDRMEQMIDDALALAREGRAISDREFVSLADVARAAWRTSDTRAGTLDVCVGDGVRVYADDDRLRRLFENLFRNAVDHGPDDVTVRVDAGESSFHVEDTGPGVPSDQRDRVFERGFTTDADGTGLGLAVVETIAEAHGWQASVETGEQGGARFVFDDVELRSTGADWLTDAAGDDTRDRR